MNRCLFVMRFLLLAIWLGLPALAPASAGDTESSGFGHIAVPQPPKPEDASSCVEPVEVMRREHMNFLLHQRDATVIDGERGGKYSLVGCMDCHNPAQSAETAIRYPDPQHFCAGCHIYASVQIDCFECHADRGLNEIRQSAITAVSTTDLSSLHNFRGRLEASRAD